jgi:Mg-chelatase subunit ChlD
MNPDQPSREQIEARLTALLLGELPADEAALLRYTMAQDPALQKLHDELQATLVLVREAEKNPAGPAVEKAAPLKLSDERRQKLLAHFKTPRPKVAREPLFWLKRIKVRSLVQIAVVMAVIGLLAALSMPGLHNLNKTRGQYDAISSGPFSLKEWFAEKSAERARATPQPASQPPAPASPTVVTLAPQPQLAPPPAAPLVQIVLPSVPPESTQLADNNGGNIPPTVPPMETPPVVAGANPSPAQAEESKESQNVVGYVNIPQSAATVSIGSAPGNSQINGLARSRGSFGGIGGAALGGQLAANNGTHANMRIPANPNAASAVPELPPPDSAPIALPPADTGAGQLAVNNSDGQQPRTFSQAMAARAQNNSGGGGGGFSGGRNGLTTPPPSAGNFISGMASPAAAEPPQTVAAPATAEFAFDSSSANRSVSGYPANKGGHGFSMAGRIDRAGEEGTPGAALPSASGAMPMGVFPSAAPATASAPQSEPPPAITANGTFQIYTQDRKLFVVKQEAKGSGQLANSNPKPGGVSGSAGNTFYRNPAPQPETPKTPLMADIPVEGSLFQSSTGSSAIAPAAAPATTLGVASDSFSTGVDKENVESLRYLATNTPQPISGLPAESRNPFVASYAYVASNFATLDLDQLKITNAIGVNSGVQNTFSPSVSALEPPQDNLGALQSGTETLDMNQALDRYASLTGRNILRSSLPSGAEISVPKSLSKKDEVAALEAALAVNGVSVVNIGDQFAKVVPSDQAGSTGGDIDQSKGSVISHAGLESKTGQAYDDAKRDLEQKMEMNKLLYAKLEAEKLDVNLPKSSTVQITDPAEPGRSQNAWQRLTGQFASTARIKVENDANDISGFSGSPSTGSAGYDPYFIQTTFETMQSEAVLGKVVDALNLQSAWAKNNGGRALSKSEAIAQLKKRLDLEPVKNAKLISITVKSDDRQEAADLANAVAEAYVTYRVETRRALTTNGVATLEEQFNKQSEDIRLAQEKVARLAKMTEQVDVSVPAEYLSEVIPIHYAKVDDIASALDGIQLANQTKIIPNESGGSLLVYATRADMFALKEAIAKLDIPDLPLRKPAPNAPIPQPEILTSSNAFSTFAMNVSDVSFKLAEASLQQGRMPDTASIRSEEFINAFDYRDPEAAPGQPMAFTSERARYPFAQNRELLRFSIKTAAAGRQAGRALNLVLLLDTSGSMERADRVHIIHEALRVLAAQLQPNDTVSVVSFARTARLWADGISGDKAAETLDKVGGITPEGGTNLEEAMRLAYETARRHYLPNGINRVVLLTDGAANLGNVSPDALQQKVEAQRTQGIALDCFGIGWEDYNDDLLEQLSSHGDGRYAFLNSPEDAAKDFGTKLAGALQVAAQDLKVQVEFNPQRVISYRQIGYAKHQLTKEQFRDNTVAAGEIAAQEAGNTLYMIEANPNGDGPIATVHVRYRIPGTQDYREHSWDVPYTGNAPALDQSSPAMRLAATASAFSEWLAASPYAQEVTPDELLKDLGGVPEVYGADDRPKQLETMIREARSLEGK